MGWLIQKYGLACDNLLSVDIVTADGQFQTASAMQNQDLFWGVRGGGGLWCRLLGPAQEEDAEQFAAWLVMPQGEVDMLRTLGLAEFAANFGVPADRVALRVVTLLGRFIRRLLQRHRLPAGPGHRLSSGGLYCYDGGQTHRRHDHRQAENQLSSPNDGSHRVLLDEGYGE